MFKFILIFHLANRCSLNPFKSIVEQKVNTEQTANDKMF